MLMNVFSCHRSVGQIQRAATLLAATTVHASLDSKSLMIVFWLLIPITAQVGLSERRTLKSTDPLLMSNMLMPNYRTSIILCRQNIVLIKIAISYYGSFSLIDMSRFLGFWSVCVCSKYNSVWSKICRAMVKFCVMLN